MSHDSEAAFTTLLEPRRHELRVHCYRMLGSLDDADDLVQETFLRAWRGRATYAGRATLRAWLYRIATNACLDFLRADARRVRTAELTAGTPASAAVVASPGEVPWLQPFPDRLLDAAAPAGEQPDAVVIERETIELTFLVALQHLPPRQRAALVLRDVLGFSAQETAEALETSVASANSALQRGRATLQQRLPAQRAEWPAASDPSAQERALLERLMSAHERGDASAMVSLMRADLRVTMPPHPMLYQGLEAMEPLFHRAFASDEFGAWRVLATRANRRPALAAYMRPRGEEVFRPFKLDVIRIEEGAIAEMTTFDGRLFDGRLFERLGLPLAL